MTASWCAAVPVAAVADGGAPVALRYRPPVEAPISDRFRLPQGHYGPGNRGLEYRTAPGQPVRSIGRGVVAFAGQVAGRLVVSVDHPDGLRSSLVGLAAIRVRVGDHVAAGQAVGLAARVLHLGVRRDGRYLDPSTLFTERGPARLVPRIARVGDPVRVRSGSRRATGFGGAATGH
jgi:murein DD-endopeptidase MepM/ murein hydrolase activator NlpD